MADETQPSKEHAPLDTMPAGISGLVRYGATSRIYEEFLTELQGPQGMKNFREMLDNCPISGAIMFAAEHLARHVTFRFDPVDSSAEAKKVADFVSSAVFDDLDNAWPDTLSEILSMLPFGWALLEMVPKRRLGFAPPSRPMTSPLDAGNLGTAIPEFATSRFNDGLIGFRSLALRAQETLFMWEFDDQSAATAMQQMAAPDYRVRTIPMAKSLLFRTKANKNNPEGRSILRNAWTSYYFRKNIQVYEGIGVERDLAGYPVFQMAKPVVGEIQPPDIWNPKDANAIALLANLKNMARNVRRDEQEGMVLPWWVTFTLASTGSRRQFDTNSIIERYDQRIAMSVLADFILVGHSDVGSKALVATKSSLFATALSAFLTNICAVFDRFAVTKLLEWNGIDQKLAPKMVHGDVEDIDLVTLGDYVTKLAGSGMALFPDAELEKTLREAAKLPTTNVADAGELNPLDDDPNEGKIPADILPTR